MPLNQLGALLCQLGDSNTYDGHGMGLHEQVILGPGMVIQPPSMDNSQQLERELGKVLSS